MSDLFLNRSGDIFSDGQRAPNYCVRLDELLV